MPLGQGPNCQYDTALTCRSSHTILAVRVLALRQSINLYSAHSVG